MYFKIVEKMRDNCEHFSFHNKTFKRISKILLPRSICTVMLPVETDKSISFNKVHQFAFRS